MSAFLRPLPRALAGLCLALGVSIAGAGALAGPKPEAWARWDVSNPANRKIVDHASWQAFLSRFVVRGPDGIARVRYGGVDAGSRRRLEAYIRSLTRRKVTGLNRGEQKALWINLYNALTVKVVLDHYPVASIRDISISPGWFTRGPWGAKLVRIEGEALSLDDIEHRILRPLWKDPRVHYALNCASLGCPDLQREAFTSFNTERLLEDAARRFVNHPRGVRIEGDRLVLSSLYEWYAEDFGGRPDGVLRHVAAYAEMPLALALMPRTHIADFTYDWALNVAP